MRSSLVTPGERDPICAQLPYHFVSISTEARWNEWKLQSCCRCCCRCCCRSVLIVFFYFSISGKSLSFSRSVRFALVHLHRCVLEFSFFFGLSSQHPIPLVLFDQRGELYACDFLFAQSMLNEIVKWKVNIPGTVAAKRGISTHSPGWRWWANQIYMCKTVLVRAGRWRWDGKQSKYPCPSRNTGKR